MTTKTAAQRGTAVSVKSLAITAICLVLVYVFTAVVNIRLPFAPNGGLIHLGNVPLFVAAILFGKRTGMIAGGIGMALFDLLSGWTLWAPFTLVIVGCMGFVVGAVTEKKKSFPFYLLALLLACAIKIGGYYLAEAVIYQNWVVPLTSIPGNLIQVGAAAIITLVVIEPLRLPPATPSCGNNCSLSPILYLKCKDADAISASFCNFLSLDFHPEPGLRNLWDAANFIGNFSK